MPWIRGRQSNCCPELVLFQTRAKTLDNLTAKQHLSRPHSGRDTGSSSSVLTSHAGIHGFISWLHFTDERGKVPGQSHTWRSSGAQPGRASPPVSEADTPGQVSPAGHPLPPVTRLYWHLLCRHKVTIAQTDVLRTPISTSQQKASSVTPSGLGRVGRSSHPQPGSPSSGGSIWSHPSKCEVTQELAFQEFTRDL